MVLKQEDYRTILKYRNVDTDKLNDCKVKKLAEEILETELCPCIRVKTNERKKISQTRKSKKNTRRKR